MLVWVDTASERPIYAQIADSLRRSIANGELGVGEKLPPASEVALGLGINKHTVLHAYQGLRDEGLVDLRRGRGAVVTSLAVEIVGLRLEIARIAERARVLGISPQTLAALLGDTSTQSAAKPVGAGDPAGSTTVAAPVSTPPTGRTTDPAAPAAPFRPATLGALTA